MMNDWNIAKELIQLVLSDGGANMVEVMHDTHLLSMNCSARSLQQALNDAILTQPSVANLITLLQKILGHLRHSSSATSHLHNIQEELNLSKDQLHQDIVARWHSTYHMLNHLLEQKRAVSTYPAKYEDKSIKVLSIRRPYQLFSIPCCIFR